MPKKSQDTDLRKLGRTSKWKIRKAMTNMGYFNITDQQAEDNDEPRPSTSYVTAPNSSGNLSCDVSQENMVISDNSSSSGESPNRNDCFQTTSGNSFRESSSLDDNMSAETEVFNETLEDNYEIHQCNEEADDELSDNPDDSLDHGESDNSAAETEDEDIDDDSDDNNENENRVELNQNHPDEYDRPVYNGAPITLAESMLSIFTFALSANLTATSLANLLKLMSLHFPEDSLHKKTVYKFLKYFQENESILVKHFYCSACHLKLDTVNSECNCEAPPERSYFIQLPIIDQLQNLFTKPEFLEDIRYPYDRIKESPTNIEDIYDGSVYKEHMESNNPQSDIFTLSFTWYTDGGPAFSSLKYSFWPFLLIINELSYQKRISKDNLIVAGIWFGPIDPIPNLFLKPVYDEMVTLDTGVDMYVVGEEELKRVKAYIIAGTGDTPARADFLNHIRFNGYYGCLKCLSPGYNMPTTNAGNIHIYPYEGDVELRTVGHYEDYVRTACETGQPQYGVKGPAIIAQVMDDPIKGTSIDIMHNGYLGFARYLTGLWFDSQHRDSEFSLYRYLEIANERIANIKPPGFIKRMPRSLLHCKYWKASEWKSWFFYYSIPVLQDMMVPKYFDHYLQLVQGIYMLNQHSISQEMLANSEKLLVAFVSKFQALYDPRFMTFNIHSILHLTEVVRDLGPLWVTSCFPYEDALGKMLKTVHGTRYVGVQIYTKIVHRQISINKLKYLGENSDVGKYCKEISAIGKRYNVRNEIDIGTFVVGAMKSMREIGIDVQNALIEFGISEYQNLNISIFLKLKKNRQLIYSLQHIRNKKFISHCIMFRLHEDKEIAYVQHFLKICDCENRRCLDICERSRFFALIKRLRSEVCSTVSKSMIIDADSFLPDIDRIPLNHLLLANNDNAPAELIPIQSIKTVCYVIKVGESTYVAEPSNIIEYDQ